ncbi:hypothetical protein HispidOSU_007139, partial [Sigmodon hispidus]
GRNIQWLTVEAETGIARLMVSLSADLPSCLHMRSVAEAAAPQKQSRAKQPSSVSRIKRAKLRN